MTTKRWFMRIIPWTILFGIFLIGPFYWWSGSLISTLLRETKSEEGKEWIVSIAIALPLVRRESIVNEAVNRYLKTQGSELTKIISDKYSESVLIQELEILWKKNLFSKNYFHAGIILCYANHLFSAEFHSHVSKEQIDELVVGLDKHLNEFLERYWCRTLIRNKVLTNVTSPSDPVAIIEGLEKLKSYHAN